MQINAVVELRLYRLNLPMIMHALGMLVSFVCLSSAIDPNVRMSAGQLSQLEEWCKANGRAATDVKMLRIDQLAELGCCEWRTLHSLMIAQLIQLHCSRLLLLDPLYVSFRGFRMNPGLLTLGITSSAATKVRLKRTYDNYEPVLT